MTKQVVQIIVEGLPNTGKIAMSHLIVELLSGLGLKASRKPSEFDEQLEAQGAPGLDRTKILEIVDRLVERGIEVEVSERDLPRMPYIADVPALRGLAKFTPMNEFLKNTSE
jgi:hypothetical protein